MVNYWPKRDYPEGFSIERLAKKYSQRLARNSNREQINQNIYSLNKEKYHDLSNTEHWANRNFDEYRNVA